MKVLITGHKGYIGVHLVEILKKQGHYVIGIDLGLYEGCEWEHYEKPDEEYIEDYSSCPAERLSGVDCVMHLAAISNDPMGDLNPEITYRINRDASIRLAKLSKEAGVSRYLFASSCSIYGKGEKLDLNEEDSLNPVSAYATSKIETELAVTELADQNFTPVFLRNATAYGHSPMLRIDLAVNNLLACGVAKGEIRIQSDGTPWRPFIHCRDIANAFAALMTAPKEKVHNQAINIGANSENYQVKDIADRVQRLIPETKIVFTGEVGSDPRNYRVNFDKLSSLLPNFKFEYTLDKGMRELFNKLVEHKFSQKDFEGDQFVRLRTLKKRLHLVSSQERTGVLT